MVQEGIEPSLSAGIKPHPLGVFASPLVGCAFGRQVAGVIFLTQVQDMLKYIIAADEPENSLSPNLQLDLVKFLSSSAVCGAQLVIATHSPLLLSIPEAKIYDLDHRPVAIRPWYELENVRLLHDFFYRHHDLF